MQCNATCRCPHPCPGRRRHPGPLRRQKPLAEVAEELQVLRREARAVVEVGAQEEDPRFHALRRAGVKEVPMARAAGTPAAMYGVDVVGMADTPLQRARSAVARAAAPEGGGKN